MNTFSTVSYGDLKAYEKSRIVCPRYVGWLATILAGRLGRVGVI